MTTNTLSEKTAASRAHQILRFSVSAWLLVATAGQWIFAAYIILFYGKSSFAGEFEKWNQVLPHGYVAGDWQGNLVVIVHVLFAGVLVIGGPLQLIPALRLNFPRFHRWLGRIYVSLAMIVSTGIGDAVQHLSISIQAVYIILFALLTIRHARARQFQLHRAWAMRLFMVVNGVWFFRVGLMFWLLVNGGPAGFDPQTFTGPFLTFLSVFTYAIPLSLMGLELYLYAEKKRNNTVAVATSAMIITFTIIMAIGIFGATMGMWLPRLK
jgi:hypothetical protein